MVRTKTQTDKNAYRKVCNSYSLLLRSLKQKYYSDLIDECGGNRGTQRQFSENICSEDDLRSRIFGKFVVKFLACLPLLGFSNI